MSPRDDDYAIRDGENRVPPATGQCHRARHPPYSAPLFSSGRNPTVRPTRIEGCDRRTAGRSHQGREPRT